MPDAFYLLFFACPKKSSKRKGTSQGRLVAHNSNVAITRNLVLPADFASRSVRGLSRLP